MPGNGSVNQQVSNTPVTPAPETPAEATILDIAHGTREVQQTEADRHKANDAYIYEYIRLQVAAVFRNAQILGKEVADYAQFMDPAQVPLGSVVTPADVNGKHVTVGASSYAARFGLDLDAYEILLGATPSTAHKPVISINNRLTGNSMTIVGDTINTVVDGKVTKSKSLGELLQIKPGQTSGSIMLENGSKLTFLFDTAGMTATDPGSKAKLVQVFVTHPDGSFATVSGLKDASNLKVETGKETDINLPRLDALVKDGNTLFMDPTGAALHFLNPSSGEFQGVFGDDRALAAKLNRYSFGGNIYNFFISPQNGEWQAQQMIGQQKNSSSTSGSNGSRPLTPGSFKDIIDRIQKVIGLPGFLPPPGLTLPRRGGSIEDLLMEDLTGIDPTGSKKMAFARQQLKNPHLDFETKLFLLLYVFLDQNGKELDKLFKQLGGIDSNGNKTNAGTPAIRQTTTQTYIPLPSLPFLPPTGLTPIATTGTGSTTGATPIMTPQNASYPLSADMQKWLEQQPISDQLKFISNLKPKDGSPQGMQQFQVWVNGQQQGMQLDQSLLQVRLTNLVRDRQRFTETITNAMKAMDDALQNTTRRIV